MGNEAVHTKNWLVIGLVAMGTSGCGGQGSSTGENSIAGSSFSTAGILCNINYSAFNSTPSVNATSIYNWVCNNGQRFLSANGLPDHVVGIFPNVNNPNSITSQSISLSLNMLPTTSSAVTQRGGLLGDTGYILNGVKVDAATAGTCDNSGTNCGLTNNSGSWNIEALGQTAFNFGTDANNAHVQPNGAYHYHGMPVGFITSLGKGVEMTLIGWAIDGFPIYARYGYHVANDAASGVRAVSSSYRLKSSADSNRPSTTTYAMGTFSQDYEYVMGLGDLDECNGRTGVTPEFPSGIYHYFATDAYPFLQRCIKGNI